MRQRIWTAHLALLLLSGRALAYIEALYSLDQVLSESTNVAVGKVEMVDRDRRILVARMERSLKGPLEFTQVKMTLAVAPPDHGQYLLNRAQVGDPYILYYKRDGNNIVSISHTGDHWQQFYASDEPDRGKVWWRMSHVEIRMNRTFNGSTPDLVQLTEEVLAKRVKAPPPDPKVPPIDPSRPGPPPPPRFEDPRDGLEAVQGWYTDESWARPARLLVEESPERGKLLIVQSHSPGNPPRPKLAIVILLHMDLSNATHFSFEVDTDSDRSVSVSVAFGAAPDWAMFETPAVSVPADARRTRVSFLLARPHFKCQASGWQHTQLLPNGGRIDKIMILIEGLPDSALLVLDRIRATRGGFPRQAVYTHAGGETRGIAWADVNGDDRLDVLLCAPKGDLLLVNQGQGFKDMTAQFGLAGGSRSAGWADYDGDGHPDLLTSAVRLFTNIGAGLRDDSKLIPVAQPPAAVPAQRGAAVPHQAAGAAAWIDHNGDGLPDLLLADGEQGILLYENTGKGPEWFRDASEKAGLGLKAPGRGKGSFLALCDYDSDGYTDFFCAVGEGALFHNEGGRGFKLDTRAGIALLPPLPVPDSRVPVGNEAGRPGGVAPIGNRQSPIGNPARGVAFADYDNDGDLDVFVPAPGKARLYRNNNDGTFTDVIEAAGDLVIADAPSVSAAWGDVNHDGFLDLFVCHPSGGSRLYLGDGKGGFRDATAAAGLDRLPPVFSASFADADDDGRLDLLLALSDKAVLAFNEMEQAPNCGSLTVRVGARKGVVGAIVRVLDGKGRPMGLRQLAAADGCGGWAPPVAHFGLPTGRYQVSVCLTDGRVAQKQVTLSTRAAKLRLDDEDFR